MVAGPEAMNQVVPMLEASFRRCTVKGVEEVVVVGGAAVSPPPASPKADPLGDLEVPDLELKTSLQTLNFVPNIRSGSFADIGPRRYMEDEHIRIDDLSGHLGSLLVCPTLNAFYGVYAEFIRGLLKSGKVSLARNYLGGTSAVSLSTEKAENLVIQAAREYFSSASTLSCNEIWKVGMPSPCLYKLALTLK